MATTTTRLGLRKPDPDPLTGDYVSAGDDLNDNWDNLDGKIPFTVCTSGTRPGTPYDGQPIRETDTLDAYVWDAANTKWCRLFIEDQENWPEIIGITRASTGLGALQIRITGEASRRWEVNSQGQVFWGDGTASPDTNLYRSAANTLKTDDSFVVAGSFTPSVGYLYSQTVVFTANGTFTKASYTGLRAIRVRVQGGGGGSGGCATTSSTQVSVASGGGGGGYAEKFILAASLAANETVTVGTGGSAGAAGNNAGGTGGTSSFGSFCSGVGGGAGVGGAATTGTNFNGGGSGGAGSSGDVNITGGDGMNGNTAPSGSNGIVVAQGHGGQSVLGGMQRCGASNANAGIVGQTYGGGAAGAVNLPSQTQQAGGVGGAGIVIVDVYV